MMHKTLFLRYALLLSLLLGLLPLRAQKGNVLVLRDSLTGKDSILVQISFIDDHPKKMQYSISAEMGKLKIQKFTPSQVPLYRKGRQTYLSRELEVQGKEREVFLPRVLWQKTDTLSILQFINDQNQKKYYYQFGNRKKVLPLTIVTEDRTQSALEEYLLSFPIAQQDAQLRKYIRRMKPTPQSYKNRRLVCLSGNINYIPKFRWGVLAGTGFSRLEMGNGYNSDNQWQWYAGAFADIPLGQYGVSFHPEITFSKVSALRLVSHEFNYDLAYNRTAFRMPFLLRYTVASIRGKLLPYIQFGPELDLRLKGNADICTYRTDGNGYTQPSEILQEKNKSCLIAGTAGIGVEIRLQRYHSLFIDARYLEHLISDNYSIKTRGWFVTASYNL